MSNPCRLDSLLLKPKPTEDAFIDWLVQPLIDAVAQIKRKHTTAPRPMGFGEAMPDPKRVTRIYLNLFGVQQLEARKVHMVYGFLDPVGDHNAPFEPAVPKCGSRNRLTPPEGSRRYGWCRTGNTESSVPPDGSGYCHEHTEAKGQLERQHG